MQVSTCRSFIGISAALASLAHAGHISSRTPLLLDTRHHAGPAGILRRGNATRVADGAGAAHVATYAQANVVQVTTELILAAIDLHRLHKLSFWDALIVRSARAAGCSAVFSEMKHGRSYEGILIENPFSR